MRFTVPNFIMTVFDMQLNIIWLQLQCHITAAVPFKFASQNSVVNEILNWKILNFRKA